MYYPLTIVDDFFDDFDNICNFVHDIKWNKRKSEPATEKE